MSDKAENSGFRLDGKQIDADEARRLIAEFYGEERAQEVFDGVMSGKYSGAVHHKGRITYKK